MQKGVSSHRSLTASIIEKQNNPEQESKFPEVTMDKCFQRRTTLKIWRRVSKTRRLQQVMPVQGDCFYVTKLFETCPTKAGLRSLRDVPSTLRLEDRETIGAADYQPS